MLVKSQGVSDLESGNDKKNISNSFGTFVIHFFHRKIRSAHITHNSAKWGVVVSSCVVQQRRYHSLPLLHTFRSLPEIGQIWFNGNCAFLLVSWLEW